MKAVDHNLFGITISDRLAAFKAVPGHGFDALISIFSVLKNRADASD